MTEFATLYAPPAQYAQDLQKIISDAGTYSPRSRQISIGPSEMGHECTRRMAYKLLDWDKPNETSGGSWAAQVGTAIHAYLAEVFGKIEGFEVEQRVTIRAGLGGTVDLFDTVRGVVLDWKTTGSTSLEKYKREGATQQQIVQVQLYGYGKALQGVTVNKVALAFLPTGGSLADMHLVMHDYDESVALKALERVDNVHALLAAVDVERSPSMWAQIPAKADRLCNWCPYFKPFSQDASVGCPGDTA
jgi:hypothetical protein